nr:EAL domain-containing protein [Plastoroseomonas hellenica]
MREALVRPSLGSASGTGDSPQDGTRRAARRLVLAGLAIFAVACIAALLLLSNQRRHVLWDTERELANQALLLASFTDNSFRSVELVQDDLARIIGDLGMRSVEEFNERLASRAIHQELQARVAALPLIEAVFLTNAHGLTIASTRAWPQPAFSIADRPHFRVLLDNPDLDSYLAPPARNVQTGTWNLYITRRIRSAEGHFLGIVGVGLSLPRLEEFLGLVLPGPGASIAIWRRDGYLLARSPPVRDVIGSRMEDVAAAFQAMLARSDNGVSRRVGAIDGEERIFAVRVLTSYPVVVAVTRTVAEGLAHWRREVAQVLAALACLAAGIAVTVLLRIRQLRGRHLLEQARTELRVLASQRRAEAIIAHLAHHDALTGLANRVLLRTRLDEAMARVRRGETCAVLCLDLDNFKDVNDTLGHPVGDQLLQAVTERLRANMREVDTVARLGGDEFAVVQVALSQGSDAGLLAQRLIESLGAPYDIDGHHIVAGVSVGIALAPHDGLDPDQLLRHADLALYRAKAAGRGCFRYYEPEMNAHAQLRRLLQLDLQRALKANEFVLHYQPQVDLRTGGVTGFEALLRWHHPERGLITPERFIPLAEETRAIVPLGEWVLRQACAEASRWPGGQKVAVNLSPIQFAHGHLPSMVATALRLSGLAPARLELEITEMVLLSDTEATLAALHELQALGVSIALDDFGTGYASLGYLQRFPFDRVKIDRSFIRRLGHSRESDAIVRSVIELCAAINMATTAEGVETEEQCRILRAGGCTAAQGYLFGRPSATIDAAALQQS